VVEPKFENRAPTRKGVFLGERKPVRMDEREIPKGWKELMDVCRRKLNYLESFKDADLWLWRHTRSPEQYDAIIKALKFLANLELVEWKEEVEE
jgi:hypothetical protein